MDVAAAVRRLGGVARTDELRRLGCSARSIAAAVRLGTVSRVRVGWFADPSLPDELLRSHAVGGRPACATVASLHGLWMLHRPCLHIEVGRTQSRLRAARSEIKLHWVDESAGDSRSGQPLVVALAQMASCVEDLDAVCAIDSALHRGLVDLSQLWSIASPNGKDVIARCDGRAESGVESVFRVRASAAGFVFRTQVNVPGGRVDFVFGDRLIVEVDGSEFHSGHDAFVADRRRDAWHSAIGYVVVRFTYSQVVDAWHEVESVLRLLHARGEHLGRTRIRRTPRHAG